ncbi:M56 family metallopeptidase [Pontibacter populi]|uniref:M56 family metallopeptidase n=1 Tax=Pontibacter populi TaxID=890055 RepID=A0ABV1RVW2_9BACT
MPELLIYLLKVNVALVLFYLAYHVALRRLTFYHLNRLFLVFGIVFSTVYPFINLSELFAQHQPIANAYIVTIPAWALTGQSIAQTQSFDYWQLPVYLFWAGVLVMLVRFIVQLISLYKIHAASEPANYKSIGFRKARTINHAFSFWQTIYLNPEQHKRDELEQILHHELIHITGWHTIDVLLAELSTVFYWFNPGAWLMKKAVKENLEFIADQNVVNTGVDKKEYQYLLLKVVGATQPQIANQFNFPSLKRRIAMMNKIPSTKKHLFKFLAVVPVAAVLLLIFGNIAQSQAETIDVSGYTKLGPDIYIKKGPTFQSACWTAPNTLTITPVNGGEAESYQLDNEQDIATAVSKYGLYLPDNELYDKVAAPIPTEGQQGFSELPEDYKAFLKRNPSVNGLTWQLSNMDIVTVHLKSGETERYDLNDSKQVAAAKRKYGALPSQPAPPTPELPAPPPPASNDLPAPAPQRQQHIFSLEDDQYYKDKLPADYQAFLKRNPTVKQVAWKFDVADEWNLKSVIIYLKSGKSEEYDFNQKRRIPAVEEKYGQLPQLPPPPPPVPVQEKGQIPPPPPPIKHNEPLVPASGAKLVEDEKTVTYVLWPNDVTKREFEVAQQAFATNGFDLKLEEYKVPNVGDVINITIASQKLNTGKSSVYNLDNLAELNNMIVVRGFKETGKFFIGTTIPPQK